MILFNWWLMKTVYFIIIRSNSFTTNKYNHFHAFIHIHSGGFDVNFAGLTISSCCHHVYRYDSNRPSRMWKHMQQCFSALILVGTTLSFAVFTAGIQTADAASRTRTGLSTAGCLCPLPAQQPLSAPRPISGPDLSHRNRGHRKGLPPPGQIPHLCTVNWYAETSIYPFLLNSII